MNFEFRQRSSKINTVLISIIISIIIGGFIIAFAGHNPIGVYSKLIKGALGSKFAIASTIRWTTPILFTGVAAAFAFKGGMFNIGVEGQLYMGAFLSALVGYMIQGVPKPLHIFLCIVAGAIGGAMWALIPAISKVYFGASEMVVTLMTNYVAMYITDYLVKYHFLAGGAFGSTLVTKEIEDTAKLTKLWSNMSAHTGILFGLLMVFLFWIILNKTKLGYEVHISGINPKFARYGGVSVNKVRMSVILISGAIAGIGGSVEVMGYLYKFMSRFSPDFGFDGLAVALLGGNTPFGVLLGAVFIGIIKAGSLQVERATAVSRSLAMIIQGIIITFVSCKNMAIHVPMIKNVKNLFLKYSRKEKS